MKQSIATRINEGLQPEFNMHGKHARHEKPAGPKYRSSGPSHRHAQRRRFHPFRWFIESIALILGLSVYLVIFAIAGGALLVLAIMAPVMLEFIGAF